MEETQIDILNRLGMVSKDDPTFQGKKPESSWKTTLEVLSKNQNPKAQKLYEKLRKKYNLNVDKP